jgi:predicted CopG family antitoxin
MRKKLTITLDEEVYEGLHKVVGRRRISRFIEDLVRPHVLHPDLEAAYAEMARDEEREAAALEWAENCCIVEALNEVYEEGPDPDEDALREGMRRQQRQLVEGQW